MSHNPCESRHEKIAALAIGELDSHEAAELLRHMETCPDCQSLYEEMVQGEVFVQATFAKITQTIRLPESERQRIDPVVPAIRPAAKVRKWKPMRILALAAAIALAASGLFSRFNLISPSFGVTFADVLQRIQKAVSVKYTRTVEVEGQETQVFYDMAMDAGRMRTGCPGGEYFVCDFINGKRLYIDPATKTGRYTLMTHHKQDRLSRYLDWISTLHESGGKLIGQEDRDGHRTNVFQIEQPFERVTVWADVHTNLPVRVERVLSPCKDIKVPEISLSLGDFRGVEDAGGTPSTRPVRSHRYTIKPSGPGVRQERITITLTDFVWDVAMDESLFRVRPPEGYAIGDVDKLDLGDAPVDEDALIAALRFWAELAGGQFPADVTNSVDVRSQLISRFDKDGPAEQEFAEALKMAHVVLNGMIFLQTLKAADNWFYAGGGVSLGDAGRPVCWWRNDGASTYRVVYGDLAVRDVPPGQVSQMNHR